MGKGRKGHQQDRQNFSKKRRSPSRPFIDSMNESSESITDSVESLLENVSVHSSEMDTISDAPAIINDLSINSKVELSRQQSLSKSIGPFIWLIKKRIRSVIDASDFQTEIRWVPLWRRDSISLERAYEGEGSSGKVLIYNDRYYVEWSDIHQCFLAHSRFYNEPARRVERSRWFVSFGGSLDSSGAPNSSPICTSRYISSADVVLPPKRSVEYDEFWVPLSSHTCGVLEERLCEFQEFLLKDLRERGEKKINVLEDHLKIKIDSASVVDIVTADDELRGSVYFTFEPKDNSIIVDGSPILSFTFTTCVCNVKQVGRIGWPYSRCHFLMKFWTPEESGDVEILKNMDDVIALEKFTICMDQCVPVRPKLIGTILLVHGIGESIYIQNERVKFHNASPDENISSHFASFVRFRLHMDDVSSHFNRLLRDRGIEGRIEVLPIEWSTRTSDCAFDAKDEGDIIANPNADVYVTPKRHAESARCDTADLEMSHHIDDHTVSADSEMSHHIDDHTVSADSPKGGKVSALFERDHPCLEDCLNNITLPSLGNIRTFTNLALVDLFLYATPSWKKCILDQVESSIFKILSLLYEETDFTPFHMSNEKGNLGKTRDATSQVPLMLLGHSLGSVICWDLIERWEERTSLGSNMGDVRGAVDSLYALPATFDALFCMGSPLGLIYTINQLKMDCGNIRRNSKFSFSSCPKIFNLFHPCDSVSYRIEPIFNPNMRELHPSLIPHEGGKRFHFAIADMRTKVKRYLSNVFSWTGDANQECNEVQSCWVDEEKCLSFEPLMLNGGERVDWQLQTTMSETSTTVSEYYSAITAHFCYWSNMDILNFILDKSLECYGRRQSVVLESGFL